MGWGDEIMAAGEAEVLSRRVGRPVRIVDRRGDARECDLWDGNPYIDQGGDGPSIVNCAGARPYLVSLDIAKGAEFTDWRARDHRGALYLTAAERALGAALRERHGPFVVVEPHVARNHNQNKRWHGWQGFVNANPDVAFVQMLPDEDTAALSGVSTIRTDSFRDACGVLSACETAVLPEGGLHHAMGALRKPAVVVFGGHTSPDTTGYPESENIYPDIPGSPCGQWKPCRHCRQVMNAITVEMVSAAMRRVLERA